MSNESIFERVKSTVQVADVVERFGVKLDRAGKACCPFHSEKTPSFSVDRKKNVWHCFGACGEGGDAIDFLSKLKGIDGLEAARVLAEIYGISEPTRGGSAAVGKSHKPPVRSAPRASSGGSAAIKEYLTRCVAAVSRTEYWKARGISDDTVRRFFLGYDAEKQAVTIPYSSKLEYYQTRSVGGKEFRKPKTEDAGAEPIYNAEAITKSKGAVFVVESPICAISIMQCGGSAISTNGTGLQKLIAEVKSKKPSCIFVR